MPDKQITLPRWVLLLFMLVVMLGGLALLVLFALMLFYPAVV